MPEFAFRDMFDLGEDSTSYRKLSGDYVAASKFEGQDVLKVDPNNYRVRYLTASDCLKLGDLLREEKRGADARTAYRDGAAIAAALQPRAANDREAQQVIKDLAARD